MVSSMNSASFRAGVIKTYVGRVSMPQPERSLSELRILLVFPATAEEREPRDLHLPLKPSRTRAHLENVVMIGANAARLRGFSRSSSGVTNRNSQAYSQLTLAIPGENGASRFRTYCSRHAGGGQQWNLRRSVRRNRSENHWFVHRACDCSSALSNSRLCARVKFLLSPRSEFCCLL